MTVAAPALGAERPLAERQLQRLYEHYKALALTVGAALTLGATPPGLARDVRRLAAEARAAAGDGSALEPQLSACATAAEQLSALLEASGDEPLATMRLAAVRASHKRLRREVWAVLPCEYVPCCAPEHEHHDR